MHSIPAFLIVVGLLSGNKPIIVLSFHKTTAHQLDRSHSMNITTDEGIIEINDSITIGEFIRGYQWFSTRTCRLAERPHMRKYRTRKGYLT